MAETIVASVLAWIVLVLMVAILWLFIVRWDLIDRLVTWEDMPLRQWRKQTEKERKQEELYVRYIKAKHSGVPFDEDEFSELPGYMRSDRLRRIWYTFIGIALATPIGIFGGFAIYESIT